MGIPDLHFSFSIVEHPKQEKIFMCTFFSFRFSNLPKTRSQKHFLTQKNYDMGCLCSDAKCIITAAQHQPPPRPASATMISLSSASLAALAQQQQQQQQHSRYESIGIQTDITSPTAAARKNGNSDSQQQATRSSPRRSLSSNSSSFRPSAAAAAVGDVAASAVDDSMDGKGNSSHNLSGGEKRSECTADTTSADGVPSTAGGTAPPSAHNSISRPSSAASSTGSSSAGASVIIRSSKVRAEDRATGEISMTASGDTGGNMTPRTADCVDSRSSTGSAGNNDVAAAAASKSEFFAPAQQPPAGAPRTSKNQNHAPVSPVLPLHHKGSPFLDAEPMTVSEEEVLSGASTFSRRVPSEVRDNAASGNTSFDGTVPHLVQDWM